MKQLDLIFEEIYGNLATVYFQGSKEKILSVLNKTYEKGVHNQLEASNSSGLGMCTYKNLNTSGRSNTGHYGNVVVKGVVALNNFYFTSFKEYKKLHPNANVNTWKMEQIKRFGLENYTNPLIGGGQFNKDVIHNDPVKSIYQGRSGGYLSNTVEILTMPKFSKVISGIEYYNTDDGECMYVSDYRTIKIMKISEDAGKTWESVDDFLNHCDEEKRKANGYTTPPRIEKYNQGFKDFRKNEENKTYQEKGIFKNIKNKILFNHGKGDFFPIKDFKINGKKVTAYFSYIQSFKRNEKNAFTGGNGADDINDYGVIFYVDKIEKNGKPIIKTITQMPEGERGLALTKEEQIEKKKNELIELFYGRLKDKKPEAGEYSRDVENNIDKLKEKEYYREQEQKHKLKDDEMFEKIKNMVKDLPEEEKIKKIEDLVNAKIRINQRIKDEEERQKNAQKECRNVEQILKTELKQGRMFKDALNFLDSIKGKKPTERLELIKNKLKEVEANDKAYEQNHPIKHFANKILKRSDRMDKENWKNQKSVETYFNY